MKRALAAAARGVILLAATFAALGGGASAGDAPLAKTLFGAARLPALSAPKSYGFYSKGCFTGGVGLPSEGPTWQVMHPSRNRRWGHPAMIRLIERLSREAAAEGWPGLLVGDISQPRGGPMTDGHASHQIGLDADIMFTPMTRRLTAQQRESATPRSLVDPKTHLVIDKYWSDADMRILRRAAGYPQVERILVNPGIKKKLCDTVTGDRAWLRKIRPFWGHDYHFHMRIGCQPGSSGCKKQQETTPGDGCDKSLAWWFTDEPWRPAKNPDAPKARDVMTMAALPRECQAVLAAPGPQTAAEVTMGVDGKLPPLAVQAAQDTPADTEPVSATTAAPRPKASVGKQKSR